MISTLVGTDSAYITMFDSSRTALRSLWILAIPLGIATVAFLGYCTSSSQAATDDDESTSKTAVVTILFLAAACVFILPMTFAQNWNLYQKMSAGEYRTTIGVVTGFNITPPKGRGSATEEFTVNDVHFSYYMAPFFLDAATHQTAPNGDPMRNGMHVRIEDIDGAIVKMEELRSVNSK